MASVATVGAYEGYRDTAYQDVIGVWTACYGETQGIKRGMKFTRKECDEMFLKRLDEFGQKIEACVPVLKDEKKISTNAYVAHLSLAYNIGHAGWCKSSIARKLNAGDISGACESITLYNRAGGKVIPGLVKRREDEKKHCLKR
jgi:lysozyme